MSGFGVLGGREAIGPTDDVFQGRCHGVGVGVPMSGFGVLGGREANYEV
jgi:hypothetical protein